MTSKAIGVSKMPSSKKSTKTVDDNSIEKGVIQDNTKPSDLFRGVWRKSKKRPSVDDVRKQAWQRNK